MKDGSLFDVWSSAVVIVGYAIPGFLFAVLLIVLFAGGSYHSRGFRCAASPRTAGRSFSLAAHASPIISGTSRCRSLSLVIGGFAGLTMLTKNCFLEEINKQYVVTARAKGLSERRVLYGHVFRNAMLLVIAGIPGGLRRHPLHRRAAHRGDLLARRAWACSASKRRSAATIRSCSATLYIYTLVGLRAEADQRPDLHAGRSAHRFRNPRP